MFLACLAIGVGAITAIGMVRESIENGLRLQGTTLLGGDAEITFSYRTADEAEMAWMNSNFAVVSEIVQFRSMAMADTPDTVNRALVSLKGVDDNYPLYGVPELSPDVPLADALAVRDGVAGAVVQQQMASRLGLEPGDPFTLGTGRYRVSAILVSEPDASTGLGSLLAPRVIVRSDTLESSGFLGIGTRYNASYRLKLDPSLDLNEIRRDVDQTFANAGAEWRDRNNPSPQTRFAVNRVSAFLVLAGLARACRRRNRNRRGRCQLSRGKDRHHRDAQDRWRQWPDCLADLRDPDRRHDDSWRLAREPSLEPLPCSDWSRC